MNSQALGNHPLADRIPPTQLAIAVLWPSFGVAILATGLFFSAFDPLDLAPFDTAIDHSSLAAYSIGFLVFWLLAAISSVGTLYFIVSNCRALSSRG